MKTADYCSIFSGKRITLMGLGTLGRGIGDARFLAECGAKLATLAGKKFPYPLKPASTFSSLACVLLRKS